MENFFAEKPKEGEPWDVVIIGSGPSSLTASIYTTRGAASTLILGGEIWGGQLMLTLLVDNYPGLPGIQGPDLVKKMRDHATSFGGELIEKNVDEVDFKKNPLELTAGGKKYLAKSVIIATGADTRWLGVPGEEKLRGRGVSSCAPCDAPFFKDKNVVVVGGGDSAMEEALVLTKFATKVTMIHRRSKFRASAAMKKKIFDLEKEGKVIIVWNTEVVEFMGEQKLNKLKLKSTKDEKTSELAADGAFVAIGHTPSTEMFKGNIELDRMGYIVKHAREGFSMATSVPGVFVAGDVHDYHYRQAITAAGFGCMAAMDAVKFLDNAQAKVENS